MKPDAIVLVIDDELDICLMVTQYLQRLHFKTHYATTIRDARVQMRTVKFDLMFVDLTLPDGSGFDLVQYKKELDLAPKIIVMSAHDNQAGKAYAMGVNLFITKPFTIKTVHEALQSMKFLSQEVSAPVRPITV
jgi:two-component system OmpR family response regulator